MPPVNEFHCYVLVRRDIPLADQIVQVGHACLEAGNTFEQPPGSNLVILEIPDEDDLLKVVARTRQRGVRWAVFYEPDDRMGYTAACTAPISNLASKRLFRKYRLWR